MVRTLPTVAQVTGTIEEGPGAFVQLRDQGGDFVGEVRADEQGRFVLHAIPGRWTIVCLTPDRRRQHEVDVGTDDVDIRVPV